MPNALLMLHYGFLDPGNPNDQLPMECLLPGARIVRSKSVARAGKRLSDEKDARAEWAARQMMTMANPRDDAGDVQSDLRCVGAMRDAANQTLDAFPTAAAEDEALLAEGAPVKGDSIAEGQPVTEAVSVTAVEDPTAASTEAAAPASSAEAAAAPTAAPEASAPAADAGQHRLELGCSGRPRLDDAHLEAFGRLGDGRARGRHPGAGAWGGECTSSVQIK